MSKRHTTINVMLLSREIGIFSGPFNPGSSHVWAVKLSEAIDACQAILWWNSIATASFKSVLLCQIFNKKYFKFKSIGNCSETFFKLRLKSIFQNQKVLKI